MAKKVTKSEVIRQMKRGNITRSEGKKLLRQVQVSTDLDNAIAARALRQEMLKADRKARELEARKAALQKRLEKSTGNGKKRGFWDW